MAARRLATTTLLLALLLPGIIACAKPTCTRESVIAYLSEQQSILDQWDKAAQNARLTPASSFGQAIAQFDAVRFNYNRLKPPACLSQSHKLILQAMDVMIDALEACWEGDEQRCTELLAESEEHLKAGIEALAAEIEELQQEWGPTPEYDPAVPIQPGAPVAAGPRRGGRGGSPAVEWSLG